MKKPAAKSTGFGWGKNPFTAAGKPAARPKARPARPAHGGGGAPSIGWGANPWMRKPPKSHSGAPHPQAATFGWGKNPFMKQAKPHKKRGLARPGALGGEWILGGNDHLADCAVVAVANSLLAATGHRADNAAIREVFDATGEASILDTLRAVQARGLDGIRPVSWAQAARSDDGLIAGLSCGGHGHAAFTVAAGLVTWGQLSDWRQLPDWIADEAWHVTWPQV